VQKVIAFSTAGSETSARTADVVKGINVLAVQFYSFLSIENHCDLIEDADHKAMFSDPQKLLEIKRNFVRFAAEELLRRAQKNPDKVIENLGSVLYPAHVKDFIDPLWEKRKMEIENLMQAKQGVG